MNGPITASSPNPNSADQTHATLNIETPEQVLQRLEWQVLRRLDGVLQGDYRTLFYGFGIDFADLREYQPEDDIRHIDWNVTARMNALHVRQYIEDREITAWFLLDLSRSMGFGPVERPKAEIGIDLAATLARLLTRSGNRVGALLYTDKVARPIPPRSSRNQVLRLIQEMRRSAETAGSGETDLSQLLSVGLNSIKRRSLIFLISDFITPTGWERPLALLNRRHELVAMRLFDRREVELPNAGTIVVEDAETGEQLYVDTSDPLFRRNFKAAAARREATLRESLTRAGVDLYDISTEADLVTELIRMANLRRRR